MKKWIVEKDDVKLYYDDFNKAKEYFISSIKSYLLNPCINNVFTKDSGQFTIGAFFGGLIMDNKMTEDDMIASNFYNNYFKSIFGNYNDKLDIIDYYKENKEFNEEIRIRYNGKHFESDYVGIDHNYVYTNMLDINDDNEAYYFVSHQVINTLSSEFNKLLGTEYDLKISIIKIEE